MIVGMKESVPCVMCPDTAITGDWLQEEIEDCLKTLRACEFNVRAIVNDNNSSNTYAYDLLFKKNGQTPESAFMMKKPEENISAV